jgi:hypothetical protein
MRVISVVIREALLNLASSSWFGMDDTMEGRNGCKLLKYTFCAFISYSLIMDTTLTTLRVQTNSSTSSNCAGVEHGMHILTGTVCNLLEGGQSVTPSSTLKKVMEQVRVFSAQVQALHAESALAHRGFYTSLTKLYFYSETRFFF